MARNKRSVALELQSEAKKAALRDLLKDSDVLIENYRPGVLDRLGFSAGSDYARLVWCSVTGFGADGTYGDRPACDAVAGAISGNSLADIMGRQK